MKYSNGLLICVWPVFGSLLLNNKGLLFSGTLGGAVMIWGIEGVVVGVGVVILMGIRGVVGGVCGITVTGDSSNGR